ncbi:MAG: DEAD/DEAH box helicase family protein, partial [Armatimonadota bacterium]
MIQDIEDIIGIGGSFSKLCPDYEYRKEQLDMAKAVSEAILYKEKLLIEAGTGVGKSFGYLIPAIVHSIKDKPVVVSTHTINLQSQLINKDIPLIQEVLKETPFKTVIMKGRSNYLCLHEMDMAAGSLIFEADKSFKQLQKWAKNTKKGDISDLDFTFPEWYEVCCNPDTCKRQECQYYEEKCFYYKMKKDAATADIIIANHSLFFSDLALRLTDSKNSILPDYGVVIFDEAHHLEDVATDIFGISFSNFRIPSLLRRIKRRKDIAISQGEFSFIEEKNDALFNQFNVIQKQEYFFEDLYEKKDPEKIIK